MSVPLNWQAGAQATAGREARAGQLHQKPGPILTVLSFLFGLAMLAAFIYVVVFVITH